MRYTRTPYRHGYSLLEVLVAMVAGVLVLGGIYQLINQNQRIYKSTSQIAESKQLVRTAMDIMSRDIRQTGADASKTVFDGNPTGNYGVVIREPYRIQVQMDLPHRYNNDTDTWDIGDNLAGNGANNQIDHGVIASRGEDEFGDGVIGDLNPDEDITYFWCSAWTNTNTTWAGTICPALDNRLYRTVTYLDNAGTPQFWTEPLADFIDLDGDADGNPDFVMFEYLCDTMPCDFTTAKPYAVRIRLQGRTKDFNPQTGEYQFFRMDNVIRLFNVGGQV